MTLWSSVTCTLQSRCFSSKSVFFKSQMKQRVRMVSFSSSSLYRESAILSIISPTNKLNKIQTVIKQKISCKQSTFCICAILYTCSQKHRSMSSHLCCMNIAYDMQYARIPTNMKTARISFILPATILIIPFITSISVRVMYAIIIGAEQVVSISPTAVKPIVSRFFI